MPPRPQTGFVEAVPAVTTPCGFDIVPTLSTRHQWFPCGPLSVSHLIWFFPDLFLPRSRPWLLTTAAGGGLEPAPASRFRGALPHRLNSYTHRALLGPLRSWRTVVCEPRKLITLASHLPIKRRQKYVTEQGRDYPALRSPALARKELPIAIASRLEHRPNQAQYPTICYSLGYQREK